MSAPEVPPEGLQLDLPLEVERQPTEAERLVAEFLALPAPPQTEAERLNALLEVANATVGLFVMLERLAARRVH